MLKAISVAEAIGLGKLGDYVEQTKRLLMRQSGQTERGGQCDKEASAPCLLCAASPAIVRLHQRQNLGTQLWK